ncbi:YggS family pyridoxal phosphate-dependent enzyme [Candidatus Pelagibacter sp.]|jgi:pyridoxal phosphate enzyme (YggS family)|nr:YggS family pyridoxal phosphate-dependent enzyme [Candidatus Pelagibacter sp.]
MHNVVNKIILIKNEIQQKISETQEITYNPNIIAVSKTFPMSDILPLINDGHVHFGENKVQEATNKWIDVKQSFDHIKLHMIGKLQTNKVKYVIPLFDYIHSLDNLKLAEKISTEEKKKGKKLKIFIQVNIGNEDQKNGIAPEKLENFYKICTESLKLNIIGLMCLPPKNLNDDKYFLEMLNLSKNMKLNDLSMGMSSDYITAVKYKSTFLRIGSKIFGKRD